jgi:hypothetical protein
MSDNVIHLNATVENPDRTEETTLAQWLRSYADQIESGRFSADDAVILFHDSVSDGNFRVRRRGYQMTALTQIGIVTLALEELKQC